MLNANPPARSSSSWYGFLLLALVFGVSYAQSPLYYSSQNQYFFHGLVRAGFGLLANDWLAKTADSWPVFTVLVNLTYRYLDLRLFYLYYVLLLGVYVYSILGIASSLFGIDRARHTYLVYLALITAMHSPIVAYISTGVLGFSLGGQLFSGVALQSIHGPMFQPATFGVLLLLSVHLFLRGKPLLAVAASSVAAIVHPIYLLSAGALTLAYMVILARWREGMRHVLGLGALAFVLVLPVLLYIRAVFGPTSPDTWREAYAVLVHFRFPHHAEPARWFGPMVYVKLAVVLGALYVVRRAELFWVILSLLVAGIGLTGVQVLTKSDTLAALFPWRPSVLEVPLSTSILLAWLLSRFLTAVDRGPARTRTVLAAVSLAVLMILTVGGAAETVRRFAERERNPNVPVMRFVRDTKAAGETYLLPRYLETFRLSTGAPAFVDFDFIPYKDVSILEWYRRIRFVDAFYAAKGEARCQMLRNVAASYGITHVFFRERRTDGCPDWKVVFGDQNRTLYKIMPRDAATAPR